MAALKFYGLFLVVMVTVWQTTTGKLLKYNYCVLFVVYMHFVMLQKVDYNISKTDMCA